MEIETERIWNYNNDNFVHRLMRMRNKCISLPDSQGNQSSNEVFLN